VPSRQIQVSSPPVLALQFNSPAPAPTLGYMNVFSENYLGKTQFCIPPVLSDLISADVVV